MTIKITTDWLDHLKDTFATPRMHQLKAFLEEEKRQHSIYPKGGDIFRALNTTPLAATKVVIMGQDPYHGKGQANGLSFAVHEGVPYPPSLKNMMKELESDVGATTNGDLLHWANQGVLLLNSVLTVRASAAASHANQGWEVFTDAIIAILNKQKDNTVFILWGRYASKKGSGIDKKRHCVIESAHPSPLSAHNGFFGSKPFSKANAYLIQTNQTPIEWGTSLLLR